MRVVLDTNVVMSALLWRGAPHQLLEAIRQRPSIQLCSSAALLEELADVLTRPSATQRLAIIGKTAREVLADYVDAVELVEPLSVPRVVPDDPDDDQVIANGVEVIDVAAVVPVQISAHLFTKHLVAQPLGRDDFRGTGGKPHAQR